MVNQQLVDYIKQQMQAGVPKDTVRKALSDAGWAVADVDDSMKAAEPAGGPAGATVGQPTINPSVAMGGPAAAATASASKPAGTSSVASSSDKFFSASAKPVAVASRGDDEDHPSVKKFMVTIITMGAVILLLVAALAFVYFNLNSQLDAARIGGPADSSQVAALQQQISQLNSEKTDLTSQTQTLTATNQEILAELGFFMLASGTSTAPVSATVKGILSGNASTTFTLTTPRNIKILVANSKDAKTSTALTPLVSSSTPVTLGGTHLPASTNLTVTSVNGTAL